MEERQKKKNSQSRKRNNELVSYKDKKDLS